MHVSVQWHDEIDDAHVYEMKCNFVGAKHLGCYNMVKFDPTSSYSFFMELAPTLIFGSTQVA